MTLNIPEDHSEVFTFRRVRLKDDRYKWWSVNNDDCEAAVLYIKTGQGRNGPLQNGDGQKKKKKIT